MRAAALLLMLLPLTAWSCADGRERIVVATTTSAYDSGLLPALAAAFEAQHAGSRVAVLVTGTGEALALGRAGDVDVIITHHPAAESAFVAEGHAPARVPLMHNDYLLAGPPDDPLGLAGVTAADAFRRLAGGRHPFVSRDDDSGTHRRELELWSLIGQAPPRGHGWYVRAGAGMADALRLAGRRGAYILTDEATFEVAGRPTGLTPLIAGDPLLVNPYAALVVLRARNRRGAMQLVDWLAGPEGQRAIARFGAETAAGPRFRPAASP
jgi:tungstate transport system substrate-binding protein